MTWIDRQYPGAVGKHEIKSECDENYNCIAYAADDKTTWWSHERGYKWPANRSASIDSLVAVFVALGYEKCDSGEHESGYQKVALYEKSGEWMHAARQIDSGAWVSKLGPDEDIEHVDAQCLCGDAYGQLHCFMRRAVSKK